MKIIKKEDFEDFIDTLIEKDEREVVGVQEKGEKYVFDDLADASELRLDYDVTILPPKKYFFPQRETLMKYKKNDDIEFSPVKKVTPRIIVGIHPYDIEAIKQMDKVFSHTYEDENYLKKREQSVMIGVNIQNTTEWSFAASMGTATVEDGYDLMITDIDDKYAVEIGSSKGSELIEESAVKFENATPADVRAVEEYKENIDEKFEKELDFSPEELPSLLRKNYGNEKFWDENAEDCYSCGTCNLVCPTCYCFDVQDWMEIDLEEGQRYREWDGCLLENFAEVAGGENFREERSERYRHRYMRKGMYLYDKFGDIACVGCGRCSSQCVPDIADPARIFNKLKEEKI